MDLTEAMTMTGYYYLKRKNAFRGAVLLAQAAERGSKHACYLLGVKEWRSKQFLEANKWFQKMAHAQIQDASVQMLNNAQHFLMIRHLPTSDEMCIGQSDSDNGDNDEMSNFDTESDEEGSDVADFDDSDDSEGTDDNSDDDESFVEESSDSEDEAY